MRPTTAKRIVQSSQPTALVIRIRTTNLRVTKMMMMKIVMQLAIMRAGPLLTLPYGGGPGPGIVDFSERSFHGQATFA